jgi:hypothetical protein
MGQNMTQQGAIITADTGISHIGLKIFYVWSNLDSYDFKKVCALRDLITRKGLVLNNHQILYYAGKLYGILESIGNWQSPSIFNAPSIMAPCNIYHFKRFFVAAEIGIDSEPPKPVYFMIFPVGRDTDFINQTEGDLEELITAIPKKLYLQHGKPDSKRWNQVVSEVDAEFAKVPGQKPEPIECRVFCRALTHTLKGYFAVKRKRLI